MHFTTTKLAGAYLIDLDQREDERGFFARAFCVEEFVRNGLNARALQANISYNNKAGTIRGLHYQVSPYEESKTLRCIRGAVVDVIVDLRSDSPTYLQWLMVELSDVNRRMIHVPEGFGHGYQALTDGAEVLYHVSSAYQPGSERGIRWDDPNFAIPWPIVRGAIVSAKDRSWVDFMPQPTLSSV